MRCPMVIALGIGLSLSTGADAEATAEAWLESADWVRDGAIKDEAIVHGVPFQSQLSANCQPNYLCGYAATNMLTSFLHGVTPTTEFMQEMAKQAKGSVCPGTLSDVDDYLSAARTVGNAPGSYRAFLSYDDIKMLISSGVPVHLGVTYSELKGYRCRESWDGGHVLVVVGYSQPKGTWTVLDPLCESGSGYRTIPSAIFRAAVTAAHFGNDTGAWTLVVR